MPQLIRCLPKRMFHFPVLYSNHILSIVLFRTRLSSSTQLADRSMASLEFLKRDENPGVNFTSSPQKMRFRNSMAAVNLSEAFHLKFNLLWIKFPVTRSDRLL